MTDLRDHFPERRRPPVTPPAPDAPTMADIIRAIATADVEQVAA